jgi:hypothetical protein
MKKIFCLLFLLMSFIAGFSQVKIINLPTATSNGAGGYIPVTQGGVTKKLLTDSMAKLSQKPIHFTGPFFNVSNDSSVTIRQTAIDSLYPYKEYVAILSQTGTADPTVIVIHNTLPAAIVWTREETGLYAGHLAGAFTSGKTIITPMNSQSPENDRTFLMTLSGTDYVNITSRAISTGVITDAGIASFTEICIRVYN